MTASCSSVLELLPWFVGDDLEPASSDAVRAHLRDCSSCRREAAALQQSTKALQAAAAGMECPVWGSKAAGEPMFAAMHDSIVQAVRTESARLESAPRSFATRWLPLAAALMLFAVGWLCVRGSSSLHVLQRRPLDMPSVDEASVRVVPWAGPRVPLQPLGFEAPPSGEGAESGIGQGMMGRGRLREHAGELGAPLPR